MNTSTRDVSYQAYLTSGLPLATFNQQTMGTGTPVRVPGSRNATLLRVVENTAWADLGFGLQWEGPIDIVRHTGWPTYKGTLSSILRLHCYLLFHVLRLKPEVPNCAHVLALERGLHYLAFRCPATADTPMCYDPRWLPTYLMAYPALVPYGTPSDAVPLDAERLMREAIETAATLLSTSSSLPGAEHPQAKISQVHHALGECRAALQDIVSSPDYYQLRAGTGFLGLCEPAVFDLAAEDD